MKGLFGIDFINNVFIFVIFVCREALISRPDELSYEVIKIQATKVKSSNGNLILCPSINSNKHRPCKDTFLQCHFKDKLIALMKKLI